MNTVQMDNLSIHDVNYNVQALDNLPVFDDQPLVEGASTSIDVRTNFDTNFQDREAFITGNSRYIEEAARHGEFNDLLSEGYRHAATLYTWRCITLGVPVVKSNEQPNRMEINEMVVEVLKPEVAKLFSLMQFVNIAASKFVAEVARLSHPETRKDFVSEAYLLTLGKLLNMFFVLDELKNIKASMKNDMSTYRRAIQSLQNAQDLHLLQELSMFFATHNRIRDNLKEELIKIDGYEELLADIVNICAHFFEQRFYVTPDEKHMFVKVIAVSLFLIDGSASSNVVKLDQKKRLNIQRFDKIFKSMPVVPLFGDLYTFAFNFISKSKSPNYDASKWPLSNQPSACNVNIIEYLKQIRHEHGILCKRVARIKNEDSVVERESPLSDEENKDVTDLARSSLQCLCTWTSAVVELITWKLANPTNSTINPDCPVDCTEEYEKATRYNFSTTEKAAIVEIIAMIKDLQCQLNRMEFLFSNAIRHHIYSETQDFTQITIREPLHKALKHKKDMIASVINSIIDTCLDRSHSIASSSHSSDLSTTGKKKKDKKSASLGDVRPKRRNVPPSHTQLYLVRTMLESLVSEKASGGRRVLRKDIEPKQSLDKMIVFLRNSYFWPYLLKFTDCLETCCDLSQFWFREFHLEIATGKRIQFPIEMSIPWILTDYVLTSQDPSLMESVLYQLDLYNDAANYSLKRFKKRHLYDEIEAEVNLCFDQFIYKLSDAVFTHYKQLASSMLLDKGFKSDCARLMQITLRTPPAARFESLLKQRHFQLLGRSIDLNRLISQRINVLFGTSLDVAISKFESEGLWYVVALDHLIETNRLCHRLLSEHLNSLNDFTEMLVEANHQVYTSNGRITLHIYSELSGELIPNFYFNTFTQRFVHGRQPYRNGPTREKFKPVAEVYEFGSKSLNASFANISAMHKNYIGIPHFSIIAKLIGYQGVCSILEGLLVLCKSVIDDQLKPHVQCLYNLIPGVCRLPRYDYTAEGILEYYLRPVRKVIDYEPLKKEFAQGLRELGNVIALCFQLENGMSREDLLDLHNSGPFTHAIPKFSNKNTQEAQQRFQRLTEQASRIQIAAKIQLLGNENQASTANDAELLTKERLCCGLNIFERILSRITGYLMEDPIWRNGMETPQNRVMFIDECREFHRLWSFVQFAILILQLERGNNVEADLPTVDEIFGDSLNLAGMTIIRLLNQHRRFDVIDFSYHLLNVYRVEPRPVQPPTKNVNGNDGKVSLNVMIERIRRQQSINNHILSILGPHLTTINRENEERSNRGFGPPVHMKIEEVKQLPSLMDLRTNRNIGPELTNELVWDGNQLP